MQRKGFYALLAGMIFILSAAGCGKTEIPRQAGESVSQEENKAAGPKEDAPEAAGPKEDAPEAAGPKEEAPEEDVSEENAPEENASVLNFPEAGVSFELPESFRKTKGFLPNGGGEISEGDGIYCVYFNYIALSEEDFEDLVVKYRMDEENREMYENFFNVRVKGMFSIYAADGSRTAEEISLYLKKRSEESGNTNVGENPMEGAELIATVGEYNFYFLDETDPDVLIEEDDDYFGKLYDLSGYAEEYAALVEDVKTVCPGRISFSAPTHKE